MGDEVEPRDLKYGYRLGRDGGDTNKAGSVAALKLALLELRPEGVERGWQ
jgi:hypothetical protein